MLGLTEHSGIACVMERSFAQKIKQSKLSKNVKHFPDYFPNYSHSHGTRLTCLRVKFCYTSSKTLSWWRHQMETCSAYWPFVRGIHRSLVNSPHKGQRCGALMFSLVCVWLNGGKSIVRLVILRRSCAHYDVIVMISIQLNRWQWMVLDFWIMYHQSVISWKKLEIL